MKILRINCVWSGFLSLVLSLHAQTFTTVHAFMDTDGAEPNALIQGSDGLLYGTSGAGLGSGGTVFKMALGGTVTTLYQFCSVSQCLTGDAPIGGLALATDGNFYGTTSTGGASILDGTVFKITPSGMLMTLYSFCSQTNCADGQGPWAGLVEGTDGNFYGTTVSGGAYGYGTVFKVTPHGDLTTLHSFAGYPVDGETPYSGLIQGWDGDFYGTTSQGGVNGRGTIFKITSAGTLTILHEFNGADGAGPWAGLIQAIDGNFYGTTYFGGANCALQGGCGTVFKSSPSGALTTLHSFDLTDGDNIHSGLVQATDGNFYGTASGGGANSEGTLYEITASGALTVLHSFCSLSACADGIFPIAGLVQHTNGTLYGPSYQGGYNYDDCIAGCGTIFSLGMGLGPFVTFVRAAGKIGQTGDILGQGFTGTTSVSLNGTAASFTIVSDTLIRATVPHGGTSGYVTVTTPSGKLTSNVPFRVIP
jgi:uncharacterized repeat protein (TIGR03803 family)